MSGRPTTALLLMWDIALVTDVIAVSRDDELMVSVYSFKFLPIQAKNTAKGKGIT